LYYEKTERGEKEAGRGPTLKRYGT